MSHGPSLITYGCRVVGRVIKLSHYRIGNLIHTNKKGFIMAKLTALEFQEKHARRLTAAVQDVKTGIDKVTVNPCELAAAKQDKMLANLTAAVQDGRWAAGLKRVSLEDWKAKARDVGANRIAAGIAAAKAKVVAFAEQLLPHIDAGQAKIKTMSDITLEDNIQRMVEFTRHMATFKRTK